MLGAIIGDIVGSRFEFNPTNDYNFELFTEECSFTDDTICTVAIADALLAYKEYGKSLHEWCRKYPNPKGGYGGRFREWVMSDDPQPYNSFGNGSAMRVSPIAWRFLNAGGMIYEAAKSAECTHNHPEGVKGAQAVALAIHYGDEIRRLSDKKDKDAIIQAFNPILEFTGYNINIRRAVVLNKFDETCQGTVPVALWIITESTGFEDAIRKAVSLGADSDTLGAIVGSIAEAIWGVPTELALEAMRYLPNEMKAVVLRFYKTHAYEIFPLKGYGDEGAAQDLLAEEEQEEKKAQMFAIMRWKLGLGNFNGIIEGGDGLPHKMQVATADSWKTMPMPDDDSEVSRLETRIEISKREMEIISKGHIPEVQEDHWFMYCTADCIRYYRSWTGMCAYEAYYHEENHRFIIDKVCMNHNLCEFGVNGDEAGLALLRYLLVAETGANAEEAWHEYTMAWDYLDKKYSKKEEPEPKAVDPWFTGTHGKICEGCIYKDGIRRMGDSLSNEIMGCGRCCRDTFKKNYESGECKFRKTDLFIPSEYELERKAIAIQKMKEKEAMDKSKKNEFETETRAYILLKSTYAAGTHFVKDQKPLRKLEEYFKLELVRECDNKHDENAVSLYYGGKHVGYVPKKENKEIAAMLEAGMCNRLVTYVTKINVSGGKVTFDIAVYLKPEQMIERKEFDDTVYFWAGKMLEKLETMPDGSRFATSELFAEVSDEYARMHNVIVSIPDEWELDDVFKTLAKWKGFRIYASNRCEGLPFNIPMRYKRKVITMPNVDAIDEVTRKPRKCPHCGGEVYRILYGEPECDAEEYFKRYGEHVILGGCCITDNDPDWECTDCGHQFRKKPIAPFN